MIEIFCANSLYCYNDKIVIKLKMAKLYLLHWWTELNCLYFLDHYLSVRSVLQSGVGRELLQRSYLRHWTSHAAGGRTVHRGVNRHVGRSCHSDRLADAGHVSRGAGGGARVPGTVEDAGGGGEKRHSSTLVSGPPLVRYLRSGQVVKVLVLETRVLRGLAGLCQCHLGSEDWHGGRAWIP